MSKATADESGAIAPQTARWYRGLRPVQRPLQL